MVEPQHTHPACSDVHAYLDRVLKSETFRKAPSLRQLLQYLVTKASEGHSEQIKESVIGIEVFGRREDFDGRIDNIVRVQAHRLRKILAVYYTNEGKDDKLRFLIPRGGYIPQFVPQDEVTPAAELTGLGSLFEEALAVHETRALRPVTAAPARKSGHLLIATIAGVFLVGILLGAIWSPRRDKGNGAQRRPSAPVSLLWKDVFEPGTRVIVSYTNPVFLQAGHSQLFFLYQGPLSAPPGAEIDVESADPYIDRQILAKRSPLFFNDGWTGTGEVIAVHRLTELSAQFNSSISVVPSRALALNDMHGANVVFLGSPWGNGVLAQIGTGSALFYIDDNGYIHARNPGPGEPAAYTNVNNERTKEISASYALFSVLPGLDPDRRIVSSAGLSTYATWAGIDFLTVPSGVSQLMRSLKLREGEALPRYFQAVIRTEIIKGVASNSSLVTAKPIPVN